jgi:hypothetical protein
MASSVSTPYCGDAVLAISVTTITPSSSLRV